MQEIFKNNKFNYDLDMLFPIIRKQKLYLYIIDSLHEYLDHNIKEIFTNTDFTNDEIFTINKLFQKLYKKENNFENNIHLKKITALKKLDLIGTYFPMKDYNKIEKSKFNLIYKELKNMWNAFKNDNKINEIQYFGSLIKWENQIVGTEEMVLDKIIFLLSDNLDNNIKIMISYVIIGAFSYVCSHIKIHYDNLIFE